MSEKLNKAAQAEQTAQAEQAAPEKDTVKIRLFKDDGKYAAPVFVGINGQTYMIQRGIDVEVPKAVAEVLERSAKQDAEAAARFEQMAKSTATPIMM